MLSGPENKLGGLGSEGVPSELVRRFSPETNEALRKRGFAIYELTGRSIATFREKEGYIYSTWQNIFPEFEALPARSSEIAIDPSQLFLPGSNNKSLSEQLSMIAEYSEILGEEIEGIEVVVGSVADYVDATVASLEAGERPLFDASYNFGYTRTLTQAPNSQRYAVVGDFRRGGIDIMGWEPEDRGSVILIAPLIVPA